MSPMFMQFTGGGVPIQRFFLPENIMADANSMRNATYEDLQTE